MATFLSILIFYQGWCTKKRTQKQKCTQSPPDAQITIYTIIGWNQNLQSFTSQIAHE